MAEGLSLTPKEVAAAGQELDLSILLVNWNTRDLLEACLRSVIGHLQGKIRYEVIVVDNASEDGSAVMIKEAFPDIRLIENQENLGFVHANNQAARLATGRYLLLLNSDTALPDAGLVDMVSYLDVHDDIGIATGIMYDEYGQFLPPYRRNPSLPEIFLMQTMWRVIRRTTRGRRRFLYADLDPGARHEVDWVTGAYLIVRANAVRDGHLLDEALFMYFEDTLLCMRVRRSGYRVMYLPLAPVVHYRGRSARRAPYASILHSFQSSKVFVRRQYGVPAIYAYRVAVVLVWGALAVVFGGLGCVAGARFRNKARLFKFLLTAEKNVWIEEIRGV